MPRAFLLLGCGAFLPHRLAMAGRRECRLAPENCAAVRRVTRRARPVGPMGPAASFSSNPINCGGGFGCVGGRGWARAGLPPTSTADPDHPLAAGAWSPPTRARKTASLAYRLQAGAGISGRTKHPRHSGGGALAGLAHYMLGWPGGGSRCADAPVYLLHSRTLPSPSQRLPPPWPKVFQGCVRYDDTTIRLCSSIQTHLYWKN